MDRFVVNALGECVLGTHAFGSVNVSDVAHQCLSMPEYNKWCKSSDEKINNKVNRACDKAIKLEAKRSLDTEQYALTLAVWKLQRLNTDRFRIYGGVSQGKPWIHLSTEFLDFLKHKDSWKKVRQIAKSTGAKTWTMYTGKMERQVEFTWSIYGMSLPEIRKLIKKLADETQEIWSLVGVSVI